VAPEPRLIPLARAHLLREFPNLSNAQWRITSPFDRAYNCFAWAAGECQRRWEPGIDYWPRGVSVDLTMECFLQAFATLGYHPCESVSYEIGFQKVAIYSESFMGAELPTHMARQDLFGRGWLSKLGDLEDIRHRNLSDLDGDQYGRVTKILRRSVLKAVTLRTKALLIKSN